jgi:MFS family permease
LGGRLADRIGEKQIIPGAMLTGGLGFIVLTLLGGHKGLFFAGLMSGGCHGFLFPSLTVLAIRDEPIEIRGKVTGVFTGGVDTGQFFGSIFLGYIGEWAGFHGLFIAAATALFMGAGLFIREKATGKI